MKYTEYFIPTLKEDPSEAEVISHKLMIRAGMIRKVAAGIYNYLPLGLRMIKKIENETKEGEVSIFLFEIGDFSPVQKSADLVKERGHELMNSLKFNEVDWTIVAKK